MRVGDRGGNFEQLRIEFRNVAFGLGKKIRDINFFGPGDAHLHHRKLRPVAVDFNAGLNFDEIVAVDVLSGSLKLVPHARFDGATTVAQLHPQIGLALTRVANFFFTNEEECRDVLFGIEFRDKRSLHLPLF